MDEPIALVREISDMPAVEHKVQSDWTFDNLRSPVRRIGVGKLMSRRTLEEEDELSNLFFTSTTIENKAFGDRRYMEGVCDVCFLFLFIFYLFFS